MIKNHYLTKRWWGSSEWMSIPVPIDELTASPTYISGRTQSLPSWILPVWWRIWVQVKGMLDWGKTRSATLQLTSYIIMDTVAKTNDLIANILYLHCPLNCESTFTYRSGSGVCQLIFSCMSEIKNMAIGHCQTVLGSTGPGSLLGKFSYKSQSQKYN